MCLEFSSNFRNASGDTAVGLSKTAELALQNIVEINFRDRKYLRRVFFSFKKLKIREVRCVVRESSYAFEMKSILRFRIDITKAERGDHWCQSQPSAIFFGYWYSWTRALSSNSQYKSCIDLGQKGPVVVQTWLSLVTA